VFVIFLMLVFVERISSAHRLGIIDGGGVSTLPTQHMPKRFTLPSPAVIMATLVVVLLFLYSLSALRFHGTLEDILQGIQRIFVQMYPPGMDRLVPVSKALLQTFSMAWIGNLIGLPLSLVLAVLAARNTSPHPLVYSMVRAVITFFRTTPPLIWAIFLLSVVGLGPRTGAITLVIATIGFCGRFFAEAIEEVHREPGEALLSLGASGTGIVCSAVLPAALPSFINTALFNLEHTTRSSAVLGIVGAGGIGIELIVSIQTFHYDEAATIMGLVLLMVLAVERFCTLVRRTLITT
ncbi:MAG TPA: phosphonate ABC transporter, permease protein PhnE, partial [Desulfobulbus sp.]|nr:phosphonate ABC transporter, permease protein PhnE [Desulfobulbus sp.]